MKLTEIRSAHDIDLLTISEIVDQISVGIRAKNEV